MGLITPKSSMLMGFFIINQPLWDTTIYGNPHILSAFIAHDSSFKVLKYPMKAGET